MAPMIEQIIRVLSAPQGNLLYSLTLVISTFGALLACWYTGGKKSSPEGKRMQLWLLVLLLAQLVLLAASWLALFETNSGHFYLPPLNRTLAVFSLVLFIWLWAYPKSNLAVDVITAIVEVAILAVGIGSLLLWSSLGSEGAFYISIYGGYWYYLGLGFLVLGIFLLLVRRPGSWGYGILTLLAILGGYIAQFLVVQPGADYGWFLHLGEMAGFILLLTLPRRLVDIRPGGRLIEKAKIPPFALSRIDGKLVQTISDLLVEKSPQEYYQKLTRVVAQTMNADYCLLLMPPKAGDQVIVPVGCDHVQGRAIQGFTTDGQKIPTLLDAIKYSKALLQADKKLDPEVRTLANMLGITHDLRIMLVPFQPHGITATMGLALLSWSTVPGWDDESARQVKELAESLISMAGQYSKEAKVQLDQPELLQKLQQVQAYSDQTKLEYAQLKAKYDSLAAQEETIRARADEIASLEENQKRFQETIKGLESRNRELEGLVGRGKPSMEEVEQLRQELRSALTDLARIPSTLSKSDQKMLEVQLSAVKRLDELQPTELVTSIAQESRQPLASIVGYTDLLLGESVGLLGAMQRKFVERVKASSERLVILMNELIQVMAIDRGRSDQTLVSADLKPAVDEAASNLEAQLSEKKITLKVVLPDDLPPVRVSMDALQQILANLLENACLITPEGGEIRLLAAVEQKEELAGYVLISVVDQGGGIEKGDLSRVFMRRYKMENPLIHGVGDPGVGLSIVKSLVDLYKGRVWVDTQEGVGSTFSVLLPLAEAQPDQVNSPESTE